MVRIVGVASEQPAVCVSHADAGAIAAHAPAERQAALRRWAEATGIRRRGAVAPLPELLALTGVAERHALFERHAPALAIRVAEQALHSAGVQPEAVEAIIVATSTGTLVPTIDARVANGLGVPAHALGLTIDGTGCAGAVRGMGLAPRLLSEGSRGVVLVVAVELCSLWLQTGEPSPHDVQANLTFGDGAAAVVLTRNADASPSLIAQRSVRWPDSIELRGAHLTESGLRHHSSPQLTDLIARRLRADVDAFLAAVGLARHDIDLTLVNPSDAGIFRAAGRLLEIAADGTRIAADVWADNGNTLAVGPLHLLRSVAGHGLQDGAHVLLVVLGPGITCELLLIRWQGRLPVRHTDAPGAPRYRDRTGS